MENYKERKTKLRDENTLVTRPIPRLDDNITKDIKRSLGGRPKKITPTRMKNGINKYFEWCEENDEIPSIKGMCIHLKLYKDMFYKYVHYPEFTDIMEHARMIISNWAEMDVYSTKGMAAGKIAYMKNIHGWSDKLETNNTTETRVISVDEAKAKIEMLAPKLLELLKNQNVIDQIAHKPVEAEIVEKKSGKRV